MQQACVVRIACVQALQGSFQGRSSGCRGDVDYAAFCNGDMQWFAVYVRAAHRFLQLSP